MKTVFINPNWRLLEEHFRGSIIPTQPLDLAYSAAKAREKHDVSILDLNALDAGLDAVPKADAFVVTTAPGYTFWRCAPLSEKIPLDVIRHIRASFPLSTIIVVGPHGTVYPEHFLGNSLADVVVKGECDLAVSKVLDSLGNLSHAGLKGVSYISEGKVIHAEGLNSVDNLDELAFPAYDLLPMDKYPGHNKPSGSERSAMYEASRGCIFNCSYCFKTLFRGVYRFKSPEKVGIEVRRLKEEFRVEYIYFIDENFGVNGDWLREVCDELKKAGVKWGCQTHFQVMSEEKLNLMADAGCVEAEYGLESADPAVLSKLNKFIDLDRAVDLVYRSIEVGIRPWLFLLAGSPGETEDSIRNTLRFVRRFPLKRISYSVDVPIPYPTTPLWRQGKAEGRIKSDDWDDLDRAAGTIGNGFTREQAETEKKKLVSAIECRLRVTLVEPFGEGGICHYAYSLCNALADYANVTLLTEREYELEKLPRNFGLAKMRLFPGQSYSILDALRLLKAIVRQKPDVVHLQWELMPRFQKTLILLLKAFGMRIAYTAHNIIPHEQEKGDLERLMWLYSNVDSVIVHSEANKSELMNLFKMPESKVSVIPHGNYLFLAKDQNKADAREKLGIGGEKVVLYFGFIREYKGLGDLIEAFALLKRKVKDARLVIAGKPLEDFGRYERMLEERGLEMDVVKKLDYIPNEEVGDYFNTADVVALPYRETSQSGVVQLAYAFGKPVVVTDVGGLSEAVDDGKSGFVVNACKPDELAAALERVLLDDKLRIGMGVCARELAVSKYGWLRIAGATALLYDMLRWA